MAYSVADCQHKYGQLHTFKTTADSCRLLRQLETAADYYTHVCSCLFIEVITHHLPNGCSHDPGFFLQEDAMVKALVMGKYENINMNEKNTY